MLAVLVAGCAMAEPPTPAGPPTYLALGDSIAFGYDPLVVGEVHVAGYPEALAARLGVDVTNASCPGEATGGFRSPLGADNHCRENRLAYPLHVAYGGTQLAFAIDFLRDHPETTLVTIDIGANDAKKLQNDCMGASTCVFAGLVGVLGDYSTNLSFIFGEIRKVYGGPLVALQIYNPLPTDSLASYGVERLNTILAATVAKYDGLIADGLASFKATGGDDPCGAGLLIAMPGGGCDIHPTPRGHALLADAIQAALAR